MSNRRGNKQDLIEVIINESRKQDCAYDIDDIRKIVECESKFVDTSEDDTRTEAKSTIRSVVEEKIEYNA